LSRRAIWREPLQAFVNRFVWAGRSWTEMYSI